MTPLVSIIIPCYNAEKYISDTIQSVINQTYSNWELIIVNDGSTDNSLQTIERFVSRDTRITLYNKKNTGVSDTRNCGIELCTGEYVAFLDADDVWLEKNLETKINTLLINSDYDYAFSNMYNADPKLNILCVAPKGTDIHILEKFLYWQGNTEVIPGPCSNLIIKKRCFNDNIIRFETRLSNLADQFFCILLSSKYRGIYLDTPLLKYRILPNSMSRSLALLENDYKIMILLLKNITVFKSFRFKQKCFSNMYLILAGSWWKDGKNKTKGMIYLIKSFFTYPPVLFRLIKKLI